MECKLIATVIVFTLTQKVWGQGGYRSLVLIEKNVHYVAVDNYSRSVIQISDDSVFNSTLTVITADSNKMSHKFEAPVTFVQAGHGVGTVLVRDTGLLGQMKVMQFIWKQDQLLVFYLNTIHMNVDSKYSIRTLGIDSLDILELTRDNRQYLIKVRGKEIEIISLKKIKGKFRQINSFHLISNYTFIAHGTTICARKPRAYLFNYDGKVIQNIRLPNQNRDVLFISDSISIVGIFISEVPYEYSAYRFEPNSTICIPLMRGTGLVNSAAVHGNKIYASISNQEMRTYYLFNSHLTVDIPEFDLYEFIY